MADRTKNPRTPVFPLQQAMEYGMQIYTEARCSTVDVDVAAVALGYKDSRNGAAQTKIGTLRYYGIVEGKGKGKIAVTEALQDFTFAPDEFVKWEVAKAFLEAPMVFKSILDQFDGNVPADAVVKMFLLKEVGFVDPQKADLVIKVFRESLSFLDSLTPNNLDKEDKAETTPPPASDDLTSEDIKQKPANGSPEVPVALDSIPIRLPKGRKAWLTIPEDFSDADKEVIKTQIDAIWVE
ncbi:hypothetical protein [Kordiimonas aestuarii]|uniref:hypothetical protein n=1 Tax=Kordiimonas aestuarii TaxID=1005925 RepID=UPI0021D02837|nr:hypothetical protein [Kordiimonas aestuarii]